MSGSPRPLRPISWWWALLGVAVVAVAVGGSLPWLLAGAKDTATRLDAVKTGLSIGAGAAAVIAFLLTIRRMRLNERVQAHTENDALERRTTDLFRLGAEMLGNDKGAVRLAGLYALERLAQDAPAHRQTITDLICAYLRSAYTPPERGTFTPPAVDGESSLVALTQTFGPGVEDEARRQREEREVRLSAQRILTTHLVYHTPDRLPAGTRPGPRFWSDIRIDLTGAVLMNADFTRIRVQQAVFDQAVFDGPTRFTAAVFDGPARFREAVFTADLAFWDATFNSNAWFSKATFTGDAQFTRTTFTTGAGFDGTSFAGAAYFENLDVRGLSTFAAARFARSPNFTAACIDGSMSETFRDAVLINRQGDEPYKPPLPDRMDHSRFHGGAVRRAR